jgi:hypothetical protein
VVSVVSLSSPIMSPSSRRRPSRHLQKNFPSFLTTTRMRSASLDFFVSRCVVPPVRSPWTRMTVWSCEATCATG